MKKFLVVLISVCFIATSGFAQNSNSQGENGNGNGNRNQNSQGQNQNSQGQSKNSNTNTKTEEKTTASKPADNKNTKSESTSNRTTVNNNRSSSANSNTARNNNSNSSVTKSNNNASRNNAQNSNVSKNNMTNNNTSKNNVSNNTTRNNSQDNNTVRNNTSNNNTRNNVQNNNNNNASRSEVSRNQQKNNATQSVRTNNTTTTNNVRVSQTTVVNNYQTVSTVRYAPLRYYPLYTPYVFAGIFNRAIYTAVYRNHPYYYRQYYYSRPVVNITYYNYKDPYWTYYDSVYYARQERESALAEIERLENARGMQRNIALIEVLNASFNRVYSTSAAATRVAEVTVLNNSDFPIATIYFRGKIETHITSRVLIDDVFSYDLPRYLYPGESATYKIPLNAFGNWARMTPPDMAIFTVTVTGITTSFGESLKNNIFTAADQQRLNDLKYRYGY
ncbi:MAG: hypothetical protein FWF00_06860 [Endomicrobia bacterium]|nr:hypothetical protein [Endomicrobiia bacterium]MCL2507385.1 hypothetical protein [Endomicrobiia bacterium]